MDLNKDFLRGAKDYELFIVIALEYINISNSSNPTKYKSRLPVLVDCTCNGLQHIAALIADFDLGKNVNLTAS